MGHNQESKWAQCSGSCITYNLIFLIVAHIINEVSSILHRLCGGRAKSFLKRYQYLELRKCFHIVYVQGSGQVSVAVVASC